MQRQLNLRTIPSKKNPDPVRENYCCVLLFTTKLLLVNIGVSMG